MDLNDKLTRDILQTVAQMGATAALRSAGISPGEICKSEAERRFGPWFTAQVKAGALRPVRCGKGQNGKRWFALGDILLLKGAQQVRASLQLDTITH